MFSNIGLLAYQITFWRIRTYTHSLFWINAISYFIYWVFQNISHWMFSFEYYQLARVIPFVLEDIPLDEDMVKSNRVQYWFWLILNVIFAFLYGASVYFLYVAYGIHNPEGMVREEKYSTICFFALSVLSIVSMIYFGFSILRIKKLITENEDVINTKIMTVHAATFSIYMLSTFVSVVGFGLYSWGLIAIKYYLMSDIFNIVCSVLTQAMICYIFWNMENI